MQVWVILIFLFNGFSFYTMNMYYLPTSKKQLKEKKKQCRERGIFHSERGFIQVFFSHREGPKLSLCLQSPFPMLEGGEKKNPSQMSNPVSGSLCFRPSSAKPSSLLSLTGSSRVAGCPCSQQNWMRQ